MNKKITEILVAVGVSLLLIGCRNDKSLEMNNQADILATEDTTSEEWHEESDEVGDQEETFTGEEADPIPQLYIYDKPLYVTDDSSLNSQLLKDVEIHYCEGKDTSHKVLFYYPGELRDFKIYAVTYDSDQEKYQILNTTFQKDLLTERDAVFWSGYFGDMFTNLAFSFTDIEGNERTYTVNWDLRGDNSELYYIREEDLISTPETEVVEETEETVWNEKKDAELRAFMAQWSDTMGQAYKEYTPEQNVDFYGLPLPTGILEKQMVPAIDGQEIEISWSETGEGESDYQIVAVYSNAETAEYLECYCYLFTIRNGKPVVLVTSQNQGGLPGNIIVFSETENQALKDGYANIIKANTSVFDIMPREFLFSSGAGAWGTYINLESDGSFTGEYHDSEMGSTGDNYPNGTVFICGFNGRFSDPQKIDDYTYTTSLIELETHGNVGDEYYEDGIRYIYSEPYGFDQAEDFLIYLPGSPMENIDEGFLPWLFLDRDIIEFLPVEYCGLYNVKGEMGFVGRF